MTTKQPRPHKKRKAAKLSTTKRTQRNPRKGLSGRIFTLKEIKFITRYAQTGNGLQSALDAGYSEASARQIATENLKKPHIHEELAEIMDNSGLTKQYIAAGIFKKTRAKETKHFQHQGVVTDTREVEALDIQTKALDMAAKIQKMYPAAKVEIDQNTPIRIHVEDKIPAEDIPED